MKTEEEVMIDLKKRWNRLLGSMECNGGAEKTFPIIVKAYTGPNRKHHNLSHILDCLELADRYEHLMHIPQCVRFAIFLHDIVYNPAGPAGENERASASMAEDMLGTLGYKPNEEWVMKVRACIMSTTHEDAEFKTTDENITADIDLAILGTNETDYKLYTQAIREEYKEFADDIFYPKRLEFLVNLLRRKTIFRTCAFQKRFELVARINLRREADLIVEERPLL